ncbi:hypothetical protein NKH18_38395 [Streptomyces sp. M10(2022)]
MDAWCALWFWPLDQVGLLDGTDAAYAPGGGGPFGAAPVLEVAAPTGPAPGDVAWRATGLFDDPDGEQDELAADGAHASGLRAKGAPGAAVAERRGSSRTSGDPPSP